MASTAQIDQRPESLARHTLQAMIGDSPRVRQLAGLQGIIEASPRGLLQQQQFGHLFGQGGGSAVAVEPLRLPSQPPVQRTAVLKGTKDYDKFEQKVVIELNQALQGKQLMGYLPSDLQNRSQLHPKITPSLKQLFTDTRDYGTFNLGDEDDLQRLTGIIVHTYRAGQPSVGNTLPTVAKVGRNDFKVVEKPKAELLEILALWNAYFQYKIGQYEAISKTNPVFYGQFSNLESFKNFENVGPLISAVMSSVHDKNQDEIHEEVRVAINTAAEDKIAAILIYSSRPTETQSSPAYVADLLANPKSIKPDRKEPGFKGQKANITATGVKGQGRAVLPEASEQRGAGNALLQHAVLESGPQGIQLWPFDQTTRGIYLAMDFGGAKFEEQSDKHLLLQPKDMPKFEDHAKGTLKEAITDWRDRYG